MIPEAAVEAVAAILAEARCADVDRDAGYGDGENLTPDDYKIFMPSARDNASTLLEAAAPHMMSGVEDKLAAIIVLLDPFERVTSWMPTDDEAGRYAVEAINKIRAILDTP